MKIAVVGKWGSGKSTLSGLLVSYLLSKQKSFRAIDADTNMHLGLHFDLPYDPTKALSNEQAVTEIKQYLIGGNKRIASIHHMVKTTPPAANSPLLKTTHDQVLQKWRIWNIQSWDFFYVWWYTPEWAGISCYHTNLAILENILSHINFENGSYCIVDMVASTDTFSNSLHLQFDKILLIVEPTKESVDLAKKYLALAASVWEHETIQLFGNKIVDHDDIAYIKNSLWIQDLPYLSMDQGLKKHLRDWTWLISYFETNSTHLSDIFSFVEQIEQIPFKVKLQKLSSLHLKYTQLEYIKTPLWDLSNQIDNDFINSL